MESEAPKGKTKILYVITQGEWGGAQRYVFDLATNLGPEYEVTVAVGEANGKRDLQSKIQDTRYKIQTIQLKHLIRRISPYHDILAIFELKKLYQQLKPDVIHLNSSKAGIIGSFAKISPFPLVYTVHGWVFNEPLSWLRRMFYLYLEKITARWKDGVIVLSRADREQAADRLNIPETKLALIPHGITPPLFIARDEARAEMQKKIKEAKPDCLWAATIANYYPTKGLDILIQAIAQKKDALSAIQFCLIGDGVERPRLENLIASLGLEKNIFLVGEIHEASRLMLAFDWFVLPSRKEGLPYALLEALHARIPVVATRVGGIPELIENKKSGLLINPDSVNELAEALVFAAENPGVMKQYAENATTPPALSDMIKNTTSLYRSLGSEP